VEFQQMLAKILEFITGKDDLERVAYREDLKQLKSYLKRRRIWIVRKPKRFLNADNVIEEELIELIRKGAQELDSEPFEPWILEVDGKRRLPVFSSEKRAQVFSGKISQQLNKVFGLGLAEVLFEDVTKLDIDFVDLNLFCQKSWEIGVRKPVDG
jgi:hypothetical protein